MQKQLKQPIVFAVICAIVFIMTEFFGSMYLGPLSLRNYAILFSVAIITIYGIANKSAFKSFRFLVFYYLFITLLGFFNGLYLDNIGLELVLARFVPMIAVFSLITASLSNHKSKILFVYFLLSFTAIDAIATILQGTGNALGWEIKSFFSIICHTHNLSYF